MSENETERNRGVDPAAAASDIRALLAAGGEGEGVIAQCRALDQWAKQSGRFLEPTPVLTDALVGGLEHRVWSDERCGVVRKGSSSQGMLSTNRFCVRSQPMICGRRWLIPRLWRIIRRTNTVPVVWSWGSRGRAGLYTSIARIPPESR